MKPKRVERIPQQTPQAVLDALAGLVRRKFYAGDDGRFFKDRWHLLQWALLWPARHFFTPKSVSLPPARYQEILTKIIMEAAMFQGDKIRYRPAWLQMVIQSHFAAHGEEYYEEAKAIRTTAENTLLALHQLPTREAELVQDFTVASKLLDAVKPQRKKKVAPAASEPDLFSL
jgi:hypothetical protein